MGVIQKGFWVDQDRCEISSYDLSSSSGAGNRFQERLSHNLHMCREMAYHHVHAWRGLRVRAEGDRLWMRNIGLYTLRLCSDMASDDGL